MKDFTEPLKDFAGTTPRWIVLGWILSIAMALGVRGWNAIFGPLLYSYDDWAHVSYVFFLDLYHALPYADQGWSYFHPPFYYVLAWSVSKLAGAEATLRTLSLLGALASVGTAALAAHVVRRSLSGPPVLPLLAFTAVAFLPVHVYTSAMTGNEMLACFLAAAALCTFLVNESSERQKLSLDLVAGALVGFAVLTKMSALTVLAAMGSAVLIGSFLGQERAAGKRQFMRLLAIGGVAAAIAGPFFVRTWMEYGSPVQFSRDFSPMREAELAQPPGSRSWIDFVAISPKLFSDPASDAPHLVHSVWGNVYLNMWFDTYGASQIPLTPWDSKEPRVETLTSVFAILGLGPTLLALYGAFLSLRSLATHRSVPDLTMLALSFFSLSSFVLFCIQVPSWAALKASYLMALSLPYAFFLATGARDLMARGVLAKALVGLPIVLASIATAFVFTSGLALGVREDKDEMNAVHMLFGEFSASQEGWFEAVRRYGSKSPVEASGLAAADLLLGRADRARRLYGGLLRPPLEEHPYESNRFAVAAALDGDREAALTLLQGEWAGSYPETLVNRGALLLAADQLELAESALRQAIDLAPELDPAWMNLATVLARQDRQDEGAVARAEAARTATLPPRGFPYGVGNGDLRSVGGNQRWMLIAGAEELRLYRPKRARASN